MRTTQSNLLEIVTSSHDNSNIAVTGEQVSLKSTSSSALLSHVAYNEMADFPVQPTDLLEEVGQNLQHLLDLQLRLRFMTREVRYLLKV